MTSATFQAQAFHVASQTMDWLRDVARGVLLGFRAHAHLYALAMAVYGIGIAECLWLGLKVNYNLVSIVSGSTFVFLFLIIGAWLVATLVKHIRAGDKTSPTRIMALKLRDDILSPERVSNTLHAFIVNGVFFVGFIAIKKAIPVLNPFTWDEPFMQLDKALHFGTLPHQWLQPLLGSPEALLAINTTYNMWFVMIIAMMFWYGFAGKDTFLRQRYLMTYLTTWTLGTLLLGTFFSSAGPCFYNFVVAGENPYADLMASLKLANESYTIWAVPTQDTLWQSHLRGHGDVEGISAMPSMHVGTAVLFLLTARASGVRWFKWFTTVFALAIFLGSIMLGWHYAVDGYAGALIALFCWWASGKYLRRRFPEGQTP